MYLVTERSHYLRIIYTQFILYFIRNNEKNKGQIKNTVETYIYMCVYIHVYINTHIYTYKQTGIY